MDSSLLLSLLFALAYSASASEISTELLNVGEECEIHGGGSGYGGGGGYGTVYAGQTCGAWLTGLYYHGATATLNIADYAKVVIGARAVLANDGSLNWKNGHVFVEYAQFLIQKEGQIWSNGGSITMGHYAYLDVHGNWELGSEFRMLRNAHAAIEAPVVMQSAAYTVGVDAFLEIFSDFTETKPQQGGYGQEGYHGGIPSSFSVASGSQFYLKAYAPMTMTGCSINVHLSGHSIFRVTGEVKLGGDYANPSALTMSDISHFTVGNKARFVSNGEVDLKTGTQVALEGLLEVYAGTKISGAGQTRVMRNGVFELSVGAGGRLSLKEGNNKKATHVNVDGSNMDIAEGCEVVVEAPVDVLGCSAFTLSATAVEISAPVEIEARAELIIIGKLTLHIDADVKIGTFSQVTIGNEGYPITCRISSYWTVPFFTHLEINVADHYGLPEGFTCENPHHGPAPQYGRGPHYGGERYGNRGGYGGGRYGHRGYRAAGPSFGGAPTLVSGGVGVGARPGPGYAGAAPY